MGTGCKAITFVITAGGQDVEPSLSLSLWGQGAKPSLRGQDVEPSLLLSQRGGGGAGCKAITVIITAGQGVKPSLLLSLWGRA